MRPAWTRSPAPAARTARATSRRRRRLSVRGTEMHSARGGADAPTRPEQPAGEPLAGPLVPRPAIGSELRDMRRKRPPALSFLLRMDTLRRVARVASLLALDFAGLFLAIFTALCIKAWGLGALDRQAVDGALEQTEDLVSFAFLVCALLFARSGLYD